jgi:bacillithiol biosynthesis cysteine-adding enzyme BshC
MVRPFTPAWLAGDPAATAILPCPFRDPAARIARTRRAPRPVNAGVLEALADLNPDASPAQLDALAAGRAAVVVTGQQVGLFLGPLYVVHKAATAIAVAHHLESESGLPVVPVFWLQTEDADFEEVRNHAVAHPDGTLGRQRLGDAFETVPDGDRIAIAHRPLGPSVEAALAELDGTVRPLRHGDSVMELLHAHYRAGRTLGEAFAGVLRALFQAHGLLVLDPRHPALAGESARVLHHALNRHAAIDAALGNQAAALTDAGFHVQVPHRPGATLLCLHPDGPTGPRYRLIAQADGAVVPAGGPPLRFTEAQLVALLSASPQSFSTTALLRPLLQDRLLPTAGYVGGPGELAYYAEMPPLYDLFDLEPPLLIPRARFRLVTAAARRCAEQLGVSLDGPVDPASLLAAATPPEPAALRTSILAVREAVTALASPLDAAARGLSREDAGLPKAAHRALADLEGTLQKLEDRLARARLQSDALATQRAQRLLALLLPDGAPQERVLGFAPFAAEVGIETFAERLIAAVRPFASDLIDLELT